MVIVIGITGPTGAGKTTALQEIEQLGGAVIDCDRVYHELLESHFTLQDQLEHTFGPLRDQHGKIDRKKLGQIVFHDPQQLAHLNEIAQRAVITKTHNLTIGYQREGKTLIAIDAIALLETALKDLCDATVAIIAPKELRVQRIMAREGISEEYARARVQAQQPDVYFVNGCNYTLMNDGVDSVGFRQQVRDLFLSILNRSR